jgi:hypothetical protein
LAFWPTRWNRFLCTCSMRPEDKDTIREELAAANLSGMEHREYQVLAPFAGLRWDNWKWWRTRGIVGTVDRSSPCDCS